MPQRSDSSHARVEPAQIWAQLTAERQTQIIRLMARLAFNLVVARPETPSPDSTRSPHVAVNPQDPA